MRKIIHCTDLLTEAENIHGKKKGFARLKPYKAGTTEPWIRLESIGLSSKSLNCNYTGQITLYIKRGGILNIKEFGKFPIIMEQELSTIPDDIRFKYLNKKYSNTVLDEIKKCRELEAFKKASGNAREINTIFRTILFPSIKKFAPDCSDSFVLCLHYSERQLFEIDLEYI